MENVVINTKAWVRERKRERQTDRQTEKERGGEEERKRNRRSVEDMRQRKC